MLSNLIHTYLTDLSTKKIEDERKKLAKATSPTKIAEIEQKIQEIQQKYLPENWLNDAANRMAKQISFSTHLSKPIHPDSKGNNVNFRQTVLHQFVGSQLVSKNILDASGNAAALPLAAFLNMIVDEKENLRLRDLLLIDSPLLKKTFSSDEQLSDFYKHQFQKVLLNDITEPITYERNKQLLWPTEPEKITSDHYYCLIPLYPTVLTHTVYNKIQQLRFSEETKIAKENRKKDNDEVIQQRYATINDLAIIKLGSSKPQNISQLNNQQGGKHYLLPSLPPIFSSSYKSTNNTIFDNDLYWQCKPFFEHLFEVVLAEKNVYTERDKRKEAITQMIEAIFSIAKLYQQRIPGWSKDYQFMNVNQKYWLDPERGELEGEEMFKSEQEKEDWHNEVAKQFAGWVNHHLKQRFKRITSDFSVPEFNEWRRIFKRKLKQQQH
ncbi:CRISPR-associated protein [Gallibacterium genomosp. 3]|uniref:CRISPR-associated protein n=1 Tax=Gallibacterium genomosp. 3 TaxID=505345 RepID=A0A1A7PL04_9PAST|nr:type I-F CRISPR-associated protein Csy1 [Gallibacterium genomosp. 3]OBX03213.1 CRISPR-associated protein [Gallibacterium genomosp. 3]